MENITNKIISKRPPVFPEWCDTGNKSMSKDEYRHFIKDNYIVWNVEQDKKLPHYDHIEMSGFYTSTIVSYGVNEDRTLRLHRHCVYPMLRKIPNDTRGSLSHNFDENISAKIKVNGEDVKNEYVDSVVIKGALEFNCHTDKGINIQRRITPSVNYAAVVEKVTLTNVSNDKVKIEIESPRYVFKTNAHEGVSGVYEIRANIVNYSGEYDSTKELKYDLELEANESESYYVVFSASKENEHIKFNTVQEEENREKFIEEMFSTLQLETPIKELNIAFGHSKMRACESIYKTKNGFMHGPGGGEYYAALWTNDQCEYVNPLFPFVGYGVGNEQAVNSYTLYMDRMDKELKKPLITSIVAEGYGYWNGVGDRGDGAMFAYGATRFALAHGDENVADRLWSGIEWAIKYSLSKKNSEGVICSDSDELENRFESGDANLFTSCLLYDALKSAVYLGKELNKSQKVLDEYNEEAESLREAIERYFGGTVEGYNTYKYYKENKTLRSWICIPLVMGIDDRLEETIKALFSDRLWTRDGLKTESTDSTFWDRSTLYALRGVLYSGKSDLAIKYLVDFTKERLIGEHVPYFVEAYPEGNQRHLSAESGLYVRIFTEGLFGIRPTGFKSFEIKPSMPSDWNLMALRNIKAFGSDFDIEVFRENELIRVKVYKENTIYCDELIENMSVLNIEEI